MEREDAELRRGGGDGAYNGRQPDRRHYVVPAPRPLRRVRATRPPGAVIPRARRGRCTVSSAARPDFTGSSSTAEIIVHQSGKFVYGLNRGHNSIVGFPINQCTGKLSLIGWT